MANTIRLEDRFDAKDHFIAWKFRIMMALEENDVTQFVDKESKQPDANTHRTNWIKGNKKAMRFILYGVKNEIVPMLMKH